MTAEEFEKDISHHIMAERYVYGQHRSWPYVNYHTGGRAFPAYAGNIVEISYTFPHRVTAVYWSSGMITYAPLPEGNHAISYDFTGCYMAKVKIGSNWYAFHIHSSGDTSDPSDCRALWNRFMANSRISEAYVFRPIIPNFEDYQLLFQNKCDRIAHKKVSSLSGCGLITKDNRCYSLILDKDTHAVHRYRTDPIRYRNSNRDCYIRYVDDRII